MDKEKPEREMIMKILTDSPLLCGVWAFLLLGAAVGAMTGQIAYFQSPKNDSLPPICKVRNAEDNPQGSFVD